MNNTAKIKIIDKKLIRTYKNFNHYNLKNPLSELLFIICSVKTQEIGYRNAYKSLKKEYPTFKLLAETSQKEIAKTLKQWGLSNHKSKVIKSILQKITKKYGKPTLSPLKKMSDHECELLLTSLPGVGGKVARCVMMYSLGRKVFPVDTHCWRICTRLGLIAKNGLDESIRKKDMDRLQNIIPPNRRYSLHVNMISLGRKACFSGNPCCSKCPLNNICPKIGI